MYAVTALRYNKPLKSVEDLQQVVRVQHECNDSASAVRVLKDLVAIAERDVGTGDLCGYSVSVTFNSQK